MNRQHTGWGYIDWLEPERGGRMISLNVGIVSIKPYAHMNAHIHFTEQVIYTLQGSGYSLVDGVKVDMSQKDVIIHWRAGVIHEMFNTGGTMFKHLMVSCPEPINVDAVTDLSDGEPRISEHEALEYLYQAIDATRAQFLNTLHYSYIIFDASGNMVTSSRSFPAYCHARCEAEIMTKSAACMRRNVASPIREEGKFECPDGLTVLYVPVITQGVILGYVAGGFVHTAPTPTDYSDQEGVYDTPQSSIQGVQLLLRRIAKSMISFCEFNKLKNDILERDIALLDKQQRQEILVANLRNAENTMTDLQINNHFLFNTLNQMASMALEGGVLPLYQSILDLSKLFNYALLNNNNIVPLDREFEYLQAYLKLQKLRYETKLTLDFKIDVELNCWQVPFNFLMPIAENAFTHGFADVEQKRLTVSISESGNQLHIAIGNNGSILSREELALILAGMRSDAVHGLSMVYRKLKAAYSDGFSIDVQSDGELGTQVRLAIPAV